MAVVVWVTEPALDVGWLDDNPLKNPAPGALAGADVAVLVESDEIPRALVDVQLAPNPRPNPDWVVRDCEVPLLAKLRVGKVAVEVAPGADDDVALERAASNPDDAVVVAAWVLVVGLMPPGIRDNPGAVDNEVDVLVAGPVDYRQNNEFTVKQINNTQISQIQIVCYS